MGRLGKAEKIAIVDEFFAVTIVGLKKVVFVVLILERDEGVAYEMGKVEEEGVILCELFVKHQPAVVDEVYPFGNGWKPVLSKALSNLLDKFCIFLFHAVVLFNKLGDGLIDDFQAAEVVA